MSRRTVEDEQRIHDANPFNHNRPLTFVTPEQAGVLLFTTEKGCLTHRVRYVIDRPRWSDIIDARRTPVAECGQMGSSSGSPWIAVDPDDETFLCHRCFAACEQYGIDHFNLIPNTGCAATDGQRYRPRRLHVPSSTPS